MRLAEAAAARSASVAYKVEACSGPQHLPRFVVSATIAGVSAWGSGNSKATAQEAAAAAVLRAADWAPSGEGAERERLALLGDSALDLLVSLRAFRAGLNAPQIDGLRQALLCNAALGGGAAGRAAATTTEAEVGAVVVGRAFREGDIEAILSAAVRKANPRLADTLEAAIVKVAAEASR